MERAIPGIVTGLDGRVSTVQMEDGRALRCTLRGSVKEALGRSRIAVGERVEVLPGDEGEGTIEAVLPRTSQLSRGRPGRGEQVIAANVDRLAIVVAARDPGWKPGFIDRMICAAGKGGLAPLVILNKIDLLDPGSDEDARIRHDVGVYRSLGYDVLEASAGSGVGIEELRAALRGHLIVFAGQSGVGKSSLANAIQPGLRLATREVSRGTRKGKHTTTSAVLIPIESGGFVLDTPGVRSFAFYELEEREVGRHFREIAKVAPSCRFRDCLHLTEPDCAVRYAADEGVIDARRYDSYKRILASLDEDADDDGHGGNE